MNIHLQVGYKAVPDRKVTKPELGHLQKAGAPALKHLREFKVRVVPPRAPPSAGPAPRSLGGGAGAARAARSRGCAACAAACIAGTRSSRWAA